MYYRSVAHSIIVLAAAVQLVSGESGSQHVDAMQMPTGGSLDTTARNRVTEATSPAPDNYQTCPMLSVRNGWVQTNGLPRFVSGDSIILHCNEGYYFGGYSGATYTVECRSSGRWYGPHGTSLVPDECVGTGYTGVSTHVGWCQPPPVVKHSMVIVQGMNGQQASVSQSQPPGSVAIYTCIKGFSFESTSSYRRTCQNGSWFFDGVEPQCVADSPADPNYCIIPSSFTHGDLYPLPPHSTGPSGLVEEGGKIRYKCDVAGYRLVGSDVRTCFQGAWSGTPPVCVPVVLSSRGCGQPPEIRHGDYNIHSNTDSRDDNRIAEGSQITYFCHNGYKLSGDQTSVKLTCQNEQWMGIIPECIKQSRCNTPPETENGNWVIMDVDRDYSHYSIGTRIQYECDMGYKAAGPTIIQCQTSGYWSDNPPKCLEEDMYCVEPADIAHGDYRCTPNHCDMFKVGTQVHYICDQGYEPGGQVQQTCLRGGRWSAEQPACLPVPTTPPMELFSEINSNTMTVVIATSCSVLLLLVVVMIIVAIQRRRPSNRLCHQAEQPPPPPAYNHTPSRTSSIDEHDRVALIAFADGLQVVLPSYEEATRGRSGITRVLDPTRRINPGEYRPLPTIPPQLRGRLEQRPRDLDSHRNSIVTTTSSTTRDNLSMAFGSIDTMNISDGTSGTTVTLDTCSGASNPSIALSQRAVAGSIASSTGSLANEDVPLLDNHDSTGDVTNVTVVTPTDVTPDEEEKLAE